MNEIMKPPGDNGRRRSAIKVVSIVAALLLYSFSAGAGTPACQRELGSTDVTLIKSVLHLRGAARAPEEQQCAAYRQHVSTVSRVREVFDRCLTGEKRDADLRQLEGALDEAKGVIARVCDQRQGAQAAPSDRVAMP